MSATTRGSTTVDHVEEYAAAAGRFATSVAWSDLHAPVVSCPGWSTYDLVVHLGNVHAWAATIVETGHAAASQHDEPRSRRPRVVHDWYVGKAEDLYAVLRNTPLDAPCWNFVFGSGVAAFWSRRQLHETTIHRVDLDVAAGRTTETSPAVAADGVGEVLDVMLARMHHRGYPADLVEPLAVTATDTGDTWVVSPQPHPTSVPRVPAQPFGTAGETVPSPPPSVEHRRTSAAAVPDRVESPADVLHRLLWHRPVDPDAVLLAGDEARVRAFLDSRLTP